MELLGVLFVAVVSLGVPLLVIVAIVRMRGDLARLQRRVDRLDYLASREPAPPPLHSAPWPVAPIAPGAPAAPLPTDASQAFTPPVTAGAAPPPVGVPPAPAAAAPPLAAPSWVGVAGARPTVAPSSRSASGSSLEQLIGGVWLQNVGTVLLLVGVFLMILWGYTTGRVGAGVLVVAGVVLGLLLAWRGDRVARSVPPFGHALIGLGLGVVYLTLYLGHVRLHVLPSWAAFGLLVIVSFASVLAGLRYRVQTIAAFGVIGAFLPILMAAWLPLAGLWMTPPGLLAYLAIVNVFVIVMTARAGWSALGVTGLAMGAVSWIWSFHAASWGWGIESGLALLFTVLGLAPLPRLVGVEGRVRPMDLALISIAPLCLIASSWPFLAFAAGTQVAMLLIALAIVQLLAALWVDARRPERDLWRPLSAAAVLFLTAALERALGTDRTPMAWCIEGVALVALGLGGRGGGWLRFWGTLVVACGAMWQLVLLFDTPWNASSQLPVFYWGGMRDLICLTTVLAGGYLLSRHRDQLSEGERWTPELWTIGGHLLLALWIGREAAHLATAMTGGGGRIQYLPPVGIPIEARRDAITTALRGAAWMAQATALAMAAPRRGGMFLRGCAAAIGFVAFLDGLVGHATPDGWAADQLPGLNVTALLGLSAIMLAMAVSLRFAERRDEQDATSSWMPELWSLGASMLLLMWTHREAGHLARAWMGAAEVTGAGRDIAHITRIETAAAAITSGAWIIQATVLLAMGWRRGSAFLRWCGLALFGLTVIKFLIVDLQTVDVFWRFVTAIAAGAAMLAMSYYYRIRTQAKRAVE